MRPLISIITVCYNCEKTIEKAICSVVDQLYYNVEYIIIDGGSTDGTLDIIRKYERYISFWKSERDDGIYDAMNKGIEYASGEYIAFLNCDDWYTDGAIASVADFVTSYPDSDVIYGDVIQEENGERNVVKYDKVDLDQLYIRLFIIHQAIFVKTKLLKRGGFNTIYRVGADYDFILRLYTQGSKFRHLSRTIVCFSMGGYSSKNIIRLADEYREISLKAISGNDKLNERYRDAIDNHYYSSLFFAHQKKENFNEYIRNWMRENTDLGAHYYIFGAGVMGKRCLKVLRNGGIIDIGFIDNDETKQGTMIEGAIVYPIDILRDVGNAVVIISSLANAEGIKEELACFNNKICICSYIEMLSDIMLYYKNEKEES